MTVKEAFDIITERFGEAMSARGYAYKSVEAAKKDMAGLFISDKDAYSVLYSADKTLFILQVCAVEDGEPDNDWKNLASWMFDEKTDTEREAVSIANDFTETAGVSRSTAVKQPKKKRGEDEGNADPLFFAKRLIAVFPDLKAEIKYECDCYSSFRGVTFTKEYILPRIDRLLSTGTQAEIDKLAEIISTQHANADMDTRSIISTVILNSIEDEAKENKLRKNLSETVIKAWDASKKIKGKKIKPEKKKKISYMAETLNR